MSVKFPILLGAIEIISGENDVVRITEDGTTRSGTIAAGTYFLRDDGQADDFCVALKAALEAHTNDYDVSVTTNGTTPSWDTNYATESAIVRIAISSGSNTFKILWLNASTTFDATLIGFVAEKGSANTSEETSTKSPASVWVSSDPHKDIVQEPVWLTEESEPLRNGDSNIVRRSEKSTRCMLELQWIFGPRVYEILNSSDPSATIESFIDRVNDGRAVEVHESSLQSVSSTRLSAVSSSTLAGVYRLSGNGVFPATRQVSGLDLWNFNIGFSGAA